MSDALMNTYARLPVSFSHGAGAWLWDTEGRRYLDALAGIAVCGLGHAHPAVTEAITRQAGELLHTSNLYGIPRQEALGAALTRLSGMDKAFFCNSGCEANEAAIKLARLYGHRHGVAQPTIAVTQGAFHGRTLATLAATGNAKIQAGFEPLPQGFLRVPFDDLDAMEKIAGTDPYVVAVLVEPITGEGGIRVPSEDYLPGLRALCDKRGWLLMLDEVQSGLCRTGRWFAHQHSGIVPDVMTLAKGLGNGVPIGACLARGAAADVFQPGNHGSTFGGNPLVCRAASAVLDTLESEHLDTRARELGERMMSGLREALADTAGVVEVRGKGLMLGIVLDRTCGALVRMGLDAGILINVTAERVVRLLPPLIISDEEADMIVQQVSTLITRFLKSEKT